MYKPSPPDANLVLFVLVYFDLVLFDLVLLDLVFSDLVLAYMVPSPIATNVQKITKYINFYFFEQNVQYLVSRDNIKC